jgi:enoyl-CoA hydratase/carnithine racemase
MSATPESVGREVLYDIKDHIALVTLNRPDKRNAINGAVTQALNWIAKDIDANSDARVAILCSSLDSTFSAGADLAEIAAGNARALGTADGGFAGFVDLARETPWIAAVRGHALAGGCELALACDMIVASHDSRFGLPEVKRGLFAGAGGVHRIVRALPRNIGLEIVVTGEPLEAPRAYALGLVNHLAANADVIETARKLARSIADNAPLSVKESLRVARLGQEMTDSDLRRLSAERGRIVMTSEDAKEGPMAFLQKRAPNWSGR